MVQGADSFEVLRPHLTYLTEEQIEKVKLAFMLAKQAHEGQTRVSGEAYIIHPIEVTKILCSYFMDHNSIIAGLMHDTIEDTYITKAMIEKDFGVEVGELVDGLSKLKKAEFKNRQAAQGENFRKMLLAMAKDIRVIIIKLADRLHNMRTISVLSAERRQRIATETLDIFAPIARRLGMHSVSLELESLAFEAIYPKRFTVIDRALKKVERQHHKIMDKILNKIRNILKEAKIKIVALEARQKNIYSIYRKMKRKGMNFAQLTDVYGARVVIEDDMDCYQVLGLIHKIYLPVSEKFKDYIAVPKPNGYQSIHTVLLGPSGVPIEIQIRTRSMDDTASNGIASHWIYKSDNLDDREHKWLSSLIDIQSVTKNPEEFIERVKLDLFTDEVYAFTPAGEIIELPSNATAMDFAYAVHTEIGNHCVAAKVDRQLAPLSAILSNGQTVEIITSKHAQPSAVWLEVVVTVKAKNCINNFLKSQHKNESIQLGMQLFKHALHQYDASLDAINGQVMNAFLEKNRYKKIDELYANIGMGVLSAGHEAKHLLAMADAEKDSDELMFSVKPLKDKASMSISGCEGKIIKYATCCMPIPGDPIMGVITSSQGLVIHNENCVKLLKLRASDDKCIHVHWSPDVQGKFKSRLHIKVKDKQGMIADMTAILSSQKINIADLKVRFLASPYVELILELEVSDRKELALVIRHLRKLSNILKISRDEDQ